MKMVFRHWSAGMLTALAGLAFTPVRELEQLPVTCVWRNLLEVRCLGCDGMHAVSALLHGDISAAFQSNSVAVVTAFLLVASAVQDLLRGCVRLRQSR
jgi:Protein of unknown function (DUF2752)